VAMYWNVPLNVSVEMLGRWQCGGIRDYMCRSMSSLTSDLVGLITNAVLRQLLRKIT